MWLAHAGCSTTHGADLSAEVIEILGLPDLTEEGSGFSGPTGKDEALATSVIASARLPA